MRGRYRDDRERHNARFHVRKDCVHLAREAPANSLMMSLLDAAGESDRWRGLACAEASTSRTRSLARWPAVPAEVHRLHECVDAHVTQANARA